MFLANFDEGTSPWRSAASVEEIVAGGDALSRLVQDGIERIAGEHAELADLIDDWQHKRTTGTLRVTGLRWRELTFYREHTDRPRPCLLGICLEAVDDGPAGDATDPQPSRPPRQLRLFYVLRRPGTDESGGTATARLGDAASDGSRAGQQASSEALQPAVHLFHLDGTSPPIHQLNAEEGGIELTGERLEANAVDYCDFFCQFVAGEEGPFTMLRRPQDLVWAEWANGQHLFAGLRLAGIRREAGSSGNSPAPETHAELRETLERWLDTVNAAVERLPIEMLAPPADTAAAPASSEGKPLSQAAGGSKARSRIEALAKAVVSSDHHSIGHLDRDLLALGQKLLQFVDDAQSPIEATKTLARILTALQNKAALAPDQRPRCMIVPIQYGHNVFLSLMAIAPNGMIEMLEDQPHLSDFGKLPIQRFIFSGAIGIPITLVSERPKKPLEPARNARALLDNVSGISPSLAGAEFDRPRQVETAKVGPVPIRDDIVGGAGGDPDAMNFKGRILTQPVTFDRVEFLDDIVFDNAIIEGSIRLTNCKILGQVSLREAVVKGSLVLQNCVVVGLAAAPRQGTAQHLEIEECLNLDGATIDNDVELTDCTLEGDVSISRSNIRGRTKFAGTRILPRFDRSARGFRGAERWHRNEPSIGLDFRYSRLERGLELSAGFEQVRRVQLSAGFEHVKRVQVQDTFLGDRSRYLPKSPTIVVGKIVADHVVIGGGLRLAGLIVSHLYREGSGYNSNTSVSFRSAEITGGVAIWQLREKATESWAHARTVIVGPATFDSCTIDGDLDLRGVWIDSELTANGIKCTGSFRLGSISQAEMDYFPGYFHRVNVVDANGRPLVKLPGGVRAPRADGGAEQTTVEVFGRSHIEGTLSLRGARINDRVDLNGCYVGRRIDCREASLGTLSCALSISPCSESLRNDMSILLDSPPPNPSWWAAFPREKLADLTISPDNDTRVERGEPQDDVIGYIRDRNPNTIKFVTLPRSPGADGANEGAESQRLYDGLLIMRTEAADLMIRDARIGGRIDCTGLWLTDDGEREATRRTRTDHKAEDFASLAKKGCKLHRRINGRQRYAPPGACQPGTVQRMVARQDRVAPADAGDSRKTTAQRLMIENTTVDGPVLFNDRDFCELWARELQGIEVWNVDRLRNLKGEPAGGRNPENRSLGVDLEVADWLRDNLIDDIERTWVNGMAVIRNTTIEGQLDVTGMIVAGTLEVVDVDLKSDFVAVHCHSEIEKGRRDRAGKPSADQALPLRRVHTVANEVDLEMLRCEGDVLLSGLVARNRLKARHMEAKGIVQFLYDGQRSSDEPGVVRRRQKRFCAAYVGSTVDLTGSRIGWLRIVGYERTGWLRTPLLWLRYFIHSRPVLLGLFCLLRPLHFVLATVHNIILFLASVPSRVLAWWNGRNWSPYEGQSMLILERAEIQRIDFWPWFPAAIDMRGLKSDRISVPRERVALLGEVLARQYPFSTEPYALAERHLRTSGERQAANTVFKWMNHRWAASRIVRWPWALLGCLAAYGIGWGRLLALGLTIFLAAFAFVASHPDNWDPPALRALAREYAQSVKPSSDEPISCSQAILKAAEIAIPMIALSPRDNASDPKLKENGGTSFNWSIACPGGPTRPSEVPAFGAGISPAGLAGILSFLGWIVWPLLFLAFSGFMRRD